jgi:hypothetical protein
MDSVAKDVSRGTIVRFPRVSFVKGADLPFRSEGILNGAGEEETGRERRRPGGKGRINGRPIKMGDYYGNFY